jgi:hypothetical protein
MYISMKYVILYVAAGAITGWLSKGDKTVAYIGLGVSALIGMSFGFSYAFLSAIEFGIGLAIASLLNQSKS